MELQKIIRTVIVLRTQAGDEKAFLELVNRYQGKLIYYLRRLIGNSANTDDILQEVWFKVWRKIGTLKNPDAFPIWLYRIARNEAISVYRKEINTVSLNDETLTSDEPFDTDEKIDLQADSIALLHEALQQLRLEYREVITLQFLERMSYKEIAEILNCNIGTVRSRIHNAKKHLRKLMEEKTRESR